MLTRSNFTTGASFPPIEEAARLDRITANRELYNNNLRRYGIQEGVKLNLFRKTISIYTNFLLSQGVDINFNDFVSQTNFQPLEAHMLDVLYLVNTDCKRYGVGITTLDERKGTFVVYEPDQWFQIYDDIGNLEAEVLVSYSDNTVEIPKNRSYDSNNYKIINIILSDYKANTKTYQSYELKGGQIGMALSNAEIYPINIRQIAPLYNGYAKGQEGLSVFDDIKDIIVDMVKIKTSLSSSISRNSRPHLVGPAGILTKDEDTGLVSVDTEGMFFPLNQGDEKPYYLQWDTNASASQFQMEENWNAYFALTDIPKMVFGDSTGNAQSGEALRRVLFPFLSALSKLATENTTLVNMMLNMYNSFLRSQGSTQFNLQAVEISFNYDKIFEDNTHKPTVEEKGSKETDEDLDEKS